MKKKEEKSFEQLSLLEVKTRKRVGSKQKKETVVIEPQPIQNESSLFDFGMEKRRRPFVRHVDLTEKKVNAFLSKVRKGVKEQFEDCGEAKTDIYVDYDMQSVHIGELQFDITCNRKTGNIREITMSQIVTGEKPEPDVMLFNKAEWPVEVTKGDNDGEWIRFISIPWNVLVDNKNAYQTAYQLNKLYHKAQIFWN